MQDGVLSDPDVDDLLVPDRLGQLSDGLGRLADARASIQLISNAFDAYLHASSRIGSYLNASEGTPDVAVLRWLVVAPSTASLPSATDVPDPGADEPWSTSSCGSHGGLSYRRMVVKSTAQVERALACGAIADGLAPLLPIGAEDGPNGRSNSILYRFKDSDRIWQGAWNCSAIRDPWQDEDESLAPGWDWASTAEHKRLRQLLGGEQPQHALARSFSRQLMRLEMSVRSHDTIPRRYLLGLPPCVRWHSRTVLQPGQATPTDSTVGAPTNWGYQADSAAGAPTVVFPDGYGFGAGSTYPMEREQVKEQSWGGGEAEESRVYPDGEAGYETPPAPLHPSGPFRSCVRESDRSFLAGEARASPTGYNRPRPFRTSEVVGHWSSRGSLLLRVTAQFAACPSGTSAGGAPDDVTDDDLADDGLGRRLGGVTSGSPMPPLGAEDPGVSRGYLWWGSWLHVLAALALGLCALSSALAAGAVVRAMAIGCWAAEAAEALPFRWAARARLIRAREESKGWSKLRAAIRSGNLAAGVGREDDGAGVGVLGADGGGSGGASAGGGGPGIGYLGALEDSPGLTWLADGLSAGLLLCLRCSAPCRGAACCCKLCDQEGPCGNGDGSELGYRVFHGEGGHGEDEEQDGGYEGGSSSSWGRRASRGPSQPESLAMPGASIAVLCAADPVRAHEALRRWQRLRAMSTARKGVTRAGVTNEDNMRDRAAAGDEAGVAVAAASLRAPGASADAAAAVGLEPARPSSRQGGWAQDAAGGDGETAGSAGPGAGASHREQLERAALARMMRGREAFRGAGQGTSGGGGAAESSGGTSTDAAAVDARSRRRRQRVARQKATALRRHREAGPRRRLAACCVATTAGFSRRGWDGLDLIWGVLGVAYGLRLLADGPSDLKGLASRKVMLAAAAAFAWASASRWTQPVPFALAATRALVRGAPRIIAYVLGCVPYFLAFVSVCSLAMGPDVPRMDGPAAAGMTLFAVANGDIMRDTFLACMGVGKEPNGPGTSVADTWRIAWGMIVMYAFVCLSTYVILMAAIALVEEAYVTNRPRQEASDNPEEEEVDPTLPTLSQANLWTPVGALWSFDPNAGTDAQALACIPAPSPAPAPAPAPAGTGGSGDGAGSGAAAGSGGQQYQQPGEDGEEGKAQDTSAWRLRELAVAAALHGSDATTGSARYRAENWKDSERYCMCGALRGAWLCGMRLW